MIPINNVSSADTKPLYLRLYATVASDIITGKRKTGEKLPSIRSCASSHGISKNTVEAAYNELLAEGFIEARPKSGFYVCDAEPLKKRWNNSERLQQRTAPDAEDENPDNTFTINLEANRIDESLFPYTVLRKLYRDTVSGKKAGLFLKKGEAQGDREFRKAVSSYLIWSKGLVCSEDSVVIGAGTEYLLQLTVKLLQKAGDLSADKGSISPVEFLLEDPGYDKIRSIIYDERCIVKSIPVDSGGISISDLAENTAGTMTVRSVYVTPSHQFPMGVTMTYRRRQELLAWAAQNNAFVIEDDYDSDFYYTGKILPSLQSMDEHDKVLYMGTFSRSLAPSMRVSYLVLPKNLLSIYKQYFGHYSCTVSRIEQHVIQEFIKQGHFERHINRTRRVYKQRRDFMIKTLTTLIPDGRISGDHAGLHFVFTVPYSIQRKTFEEKALQKGLKIKTLETPPDDRNIQCIIGYAHLSEENMVNAAEIISTVLHDA